MIRLLKFEFRKLRKQKSFYICTVFMLALLLLSAITMHELGDANAPFTISYGSAAEFTLNTLNGSNFIFISAVFTVLSVCDDYEQQIVKNIYAKGFTRSAVFAAKWITVFAAVSIMFIIVYIVSFALGNLYLPMGDVRPLVSDFVYTICRMHCRNQLNLCDLFLLT